MKNIWWVVDVGEGVVEQSIQVFGVSFRNSSLFFYLFSWVVLFPAPSPSGWVRCVCVCVFESFAAVLWSVAQEFSGNPISFGRVGFGGILYQFICF